MAWLLFFEQTLSVAFFLALHWIEKPIKNEVRPSLARLHIIDTFFHCMFLGASAFLEQFPRLRRDMFLSTRLLGKDGESLRETDFGTY